MTTPRDDPTKDSDFYEGTLRVFEEERTRAAEGRVVIRDKDVEWRQVRQGHVGYYLHDSFVTDSAVTGWRVFSQKIESMSGKHRHQGSTVIYVRRGHGYTVVNGKTFNWKAGDVVMLPILPGGVEHQHFRDDDSEPCEWVALVYGPFHRALGSMFGQVEASPRWEGDR